MAETVETQFQFLIDKIRRNKGVDFSLYRQATLKRRVEARLRSVGCSDYSDYIFYLNREPDEYDRLLATVTVHVTEFFRDEETFEVLRTKVLPEMLRFKKSRRRTILRAWSVGTSDGAEAYSLAMMISEAVDKTGSGFYFRVTGTDIDPDSIARAKSGLYPEKSVEKIPEPALSKYFNLRDDAYEVRPELRNLVRFKVHNLISDPPMNYMDLILCRNVLIYFSRPLQEAAYGSFAKSLNEGGFLVLGKVETLWGYPSSQFETVNSQERIYRKVLSAAQTRAGIMEGRIFT